MALTTARSRRRWRRCLALRVHHVHIWPLSTSEVALIAHLVIPVGYPGDAFLHETNAMLHDEFEIGHVTLQIEQGEGGKCAIEPANVG